jgi:FKBP-type peptidyl-prolyl cis-trans isomerase (trigger factor)
MKWEFLEPEQGYRRMTIEADWEEIASEYHDIVDDYAKVPIPGFRLGKTPKQVVERRFQAKIADDLSRRCAQLFGREALQQSGAEAAGPLEVSDIACAKGTPLRFIARFLALPDFDLPDLASIRIRQDCEDRLSGLSQWLLAQVRIRLPDELVRAELALDGKETAEPESNDWAAAAERVKLMLILKKIARQDGIEVDASDVETRIKEKASAFGTTAKELQSQLEKGGGTERLHNMLVAERTLQYLLETVEKQ